MKHQNKKSFPEKINSSKLDMDTWWSGSTKSKKKSTETRKEDRCTSTTWKAQTLSGTSIDFPHEPTEKYRIPATQFKTTLNYKIFLKKK